MHSVWQALRSLLAGNPGKRDRRAVSKLARADTGKILSSGIPIVAMTVSESDRQALMEASVNENFQLHFAESCEQAPATIEWLSAPVVLLDRNWPRTEWRSAVQKLSSCSPRPCVILVSSVADDALWEEVVRCGGYDVLAKPLKPEHAARAIRLALSYQQVASRPLKHAHI